MEELGQRIAMHRKELGVTQVEMAEKFGCSQSMIAGYESGVRRLPVSFLPELARMFEISVDELLGYSPGKKKAKLKKPVFPSSNCTSTLYNKPASSHDAVFTSGHDAPSSL